MGQHRVGLVCLGLIGLVFRQDFVFSRSLSRVLRQVAPWQRRSGGSSDDWRYQGVSSLPIDMVAPGGHLSPPAVDNDWGSVGHPAGELQPPDSIISVQCGEGRMVVTVKRDLYGDGKPLRDSDLTLGPQSCGAGPRSSHTTVVFETGLKECGNSLQMTPDWLIYSTSLTLNPTANAQNMPITRKNPAVIPIECYYPRFTNVSSNSLLPTWLPFATTESSEERLVFSLHLMTEDWSAPRSSLLFHLGDVFYVEASVETQNHVPLILFIDGCVATTSPNISSTPRYELIANSGCLIDGTQEDSSSAFRSPRPQQDKLQFIVDAFRFTDSQESTIYLTCSLRAAADTQVPDPMNKACSYSKSSNSWAAVEGPDEICRCCSTPSCVAPSGHSRVWGPSYRRPARRDVLPGRRSEDRQAVVSVGPLLVLGEDQGQSLAVQGSGVLEVWVLGGAGGLGLVILLVGVVLAASLKRTPYPQAVRE